MTSLQVTGYRLQVKTEQKRLSALSSIQCTTPNLIVIPAKAGIQLDKDGSRVEHGMTEGVKRIRAWSLRLGTHLGQLEIRLIRAIAGGGIS